MDRPLLGRDDGASAERSLNSLLGTGRCRWILPKIWACGSGWAEAGRQPDRSHAAVSGGCGRGRHRAQEPGPRRCTLSGLTTQSPPPSSVKNHGECKARGGEVRGNLGAGCAHTVAGAEKTL
ncbi:hypothetical protein NDU88_003141 [Pleurodeles waltl]|uniref:Uncharacterized protein n=1 Tax=Pleurodeles waltl TaxID=8319 RepID=A0AAV7TML9_PLEWA|nr:hypothetical protein NDU88_003141 [Pleurodeles waltl]